MIQNGIYSFHPIINTELSISIKDKSEENEANLILEQFSNEIHQLFYILFDKDHDKGMSPKSVISPK